jgi:glycosyltransferase involved in cell wall biosynthesis
MSATATQQVAARVSVIVPVRNDAGHLRRCLEALRASEYRDFELIVVDDASTDETPRVAEELGARVVRMERNGGPGRARNRGAEEAQGEVVFFIDADVCVQPDTVGKVAESFASDPNLAAVFGSYDLTPGVPSFLSQYKNLFHHYVHQRASERASTFWAGCGAVRKGVFREMGGFDVEYGRPSIEDIEFGARMYKAGHKILLRKDLEVTHLKRWTLWGLLKTDVLDRGIPWTRLILREKSLPNDLNLKTSQRVCAILAYLLVAAVLVGILYPKALWVAGGCLAGIVLLNLDFYRFFLLQRGWWFTARVVPMHVLYYVYSAAAFATGVALHLWDTKVARAPKAVGVARAPQAP